MIILCLTRILFSFSEILKHLYTLNRFICSSTITTHILDLVTSRLGPCTPRQHLSEEKWDLIQPLISRRVPVELHCRKNQHRWTSMTILIRPLTQYWKITGAANFWERSNYRLSSFDKIKLGRLVFRIKIYSYFIVYYKT